MEKLRKQFEKETGKKFSLSRLMAYALWLEKKLERPIEGVGEAEKKKAIELLMRWYSRWENDDPNFHDGTLQCETEYFIGNSRASAPTVQGKNHFDTGVTVQEGEHEDWDVDSRSVTVQDTQQERS